MKGIICLFLLFSSCATQYTRGVKIDTRNIKSNVWDCAVTVETRTAIQQKDVFFNNAWVMVQPNSKLLIKHLDGAGEIFFGSINEDLDRKKASVKLTNCKKGLDLVLYQHNIKYDLDNDCQKYVKLANKKQ